MGASTLIPPPAAGPRLRKKDFRTNDIVGVVQDLVANYAHETEKFAKRFPRSKRGLKMLFDWVHNHFTYEEDPAGAQIVQTPAHLNRGRVGDCKSFTVFISSVLQNMGIDHVIRYAAYGTKEFRHVYPVALLDGEEIPVDVVWKVQNGGHFDGEKTYTKKRDYHVKGLYQIGSVGHGIDWNAGEAAILGQLEKRVSIQEIDRMAAELPEVHPKADVTRMTKGETERLVWQDRFEILAKLSKGGTAGTMADAANALKQGSLAGIGSLKNDPVGRQVETILAKTARMTEPAFPPFEVAIETPPQVGLFKKVGDWFKKVGKSIGNLFKKLVNFVFSGAGKAMGPFFIFRFLKRTVIKSKKIKSRLAQQDKSYGFIQKIGKFDDKQLQGLMLNGILEKTGKTPQQLAADGGVPQIGAFPAVVAAVVKAIGFVVNIIQKIASIFKKKGTDYGTVDQSTMSDPNLFAEEAELHRKDRSGGGSGGGFNPLLLAPLALIPLLR